MTGRHYVPCRICGDDHKNPASSSLCNECGPIERLKNLDRNAKIEEMIRVSRIQNDTNKEISQSIMLMMSSDPYIDVYLEEGLVRLDGDFTIDDLQIIINKLKGK